MAALTTTPFTQPNSMAVVLKAEFSINPWVSGVVIAVLTWLVIIGGVKSIGRAVEKLSPLKVGLYLAGGLFVIARQRRRSCRRCFAADLPRGVLASGRDREQRPAWA